jgi:serine protease AprX
VSTWAAFDFGGAHIEAIVGFIYQEQRTMKRFRKIIQIFIVLTFILGLLGPVVLPASTVTSKAHPLLIQLAAKEPDRRVSVIVQKTTSGLDLEARVTRLGGEVTKDLHIINAFAAELPAGAAVALARDPAVRRVSLDAPVERSTIAMQALRDNFDSYSYGNNDGSLSFAGDWQEGGESDGPTSGRVQIDRSWSCASVNCLRISTQRAGRKLTRAFDLSGAGTATLSFTYRRSAYYYTYNHGRIDVEISGDGGTTFTTLASYNMRYQDYYPVAESLDISAYVSADMQVRFEVVDDGDDSTYLFIDDLEVSFAYPDKPNTYLSTTGADKLHAQGLSGAGIGVVVIDSGVQDHADLSGRLFLPAGYPAGDPYGHGTHVAGIVAGSGTSAQGVYEGLAPGAHIINLNITDSNGMAYESDVVNALQWVYENKEGYNIRVVNMSLNSTLENSYHESPLAAASEILWFNGVVVVASVGNKGPAGGHNTAKTAPANDPFLIIVGASDEHDTPDRGDDNIGAFSSFGVTVDGFLRPEIVAPGFNIIAPLSADSYWGEEHPDRVVADQYIRLSGTSMAAPVVAGAAALLLQNEPNLTPDQVKYRLLNTGGSISNDDFTFPYLDIYAAVHNSTLESANSGLMASQLLWTGDDPVTWGSVAWNSVAWNSVAWNSVAWNSVAWNSVAWNSAVELDGIFWGPRGRNK